MVYNHKLIDAGFFTVRHLFDSNRNFKGLSCPRLLHLWPVDHSLLASLVDAIPEKWRKQLKANGAMTSLNEHCIDCMVFHCILKEERFIQIRSNLNYCMKRFLLKSRVRKYAKFGIFYAKIVQMTPLGLRRESLWLQKSSVTNIVLSLPFSQQIQFTLIVNAVNLN